MDGAIRHPSLEQDSFRHPCGLPTLPRCIATHEALLKSKLCNLGPPTLPYWDPVATNPSPKRNIGFSGLTSNHDQAITSTNRSGWLMVLDKYLKFTMQKWATSPASGSILGPTKTKVKDYCGSLQPDSTSSPSTLARQQYWIKHELWLRKIC